MVQFKKDTWEIDEFDCASIFLLVGEEKAMVIDCGMGLGDLRGAIEMITDKPLICAISHGHVDHTGNARQFEDVWIHPKDATAPMPQSLERRKWDIERIAHRQKDCIGSPYTMFPLYPYDLETDLAGMEEGPVPRLHALEDGMRFDLGGGRIVTAYECPGHSAGEMVFLDEKTRTLIAGDAINYNLGIGAVPVEKSLRFYRRLYEMRDQWDGIYNGHHDFRALGAPLGEDCLPTIIAMMEDALEGRLIPTENPSFWGQGVPLTKGTADPMAKAPAMSLSGPPRNRVTLRRGRNYLGIDPDKLREEKGEV